MTGDKETPDTIFQRINRRRLELERGIGDGAGPLQSAPVAPRVQPSEPLEQVVFHEQRSRFTGAGDPVEHSGAGTRHFAAGNDEFPRSATMRLILKHPALALGIGIPAAGLLAASPAARRIMAVALRVGTRPEFQQLMLLSTLAAGGGRLPADAVDDQPSSSLDAPPGSGPGPTIR